MNLDDMVLVSVDDHVVEPPHVFEGRLPKKFAELAPHVVRQPDGTDQWEFLGLNIPNVGLNAVAGRPKDEYGIDPTSFDELRPGTYDVHERIKDMNANGVLGSLNFPSLPGFAGRLFMAEQDAEARLALLRAYNDWHIEDWCGAYPERFIPLAVPALWDPEVCAAEIRRVAEKGCHAITFPENTVPLDMPSLHTDHWDPIWEACCEVGTIVCMHIGSSSQLVQTAPDAPIDVMILLQPMAIVQAAADVLHSPIWRKFTELRIAWSEGGIGWIPYFLERARHSFETHSAWTGAEVPDGQSIVDFFLEHSVLCFIDDPVGVQLAREIGTANITIETDYPHSDAIWPNAPEVLWPQFEGAELSDHEVDEITHLNAMREFSYDPLGTLSREQCTVSSLRAEAAGHDVSIVSKGKRTERSGKITLDDLEVTA